jgi:hypothetical protein
MNTDKTILDIRDAATTGENPGIAFICVHLCPKPFARNDHDA